jgi:beta-galactosidase
VAYQPEEYAAYLHERNYEVLSGKPYLWGTYVCNMFDSGSDRRYTDRAYPVIDVKVYSNASVVLSVNGNPDGTLSAEQCEQRACVFEDVRLSPGANTVVATGVHGDATVQDTVEWSMNATDINIAAGRLATGYVSQTVFASIQTTFSWVPPAHKTCIRKSAYRNPRPTA